MRSSTPSASPVVVASAPSARSIVLVGMMGAGKTSVGGRLAERRGWALFDSDRQVEEMVGRSVAEIWMADGEAGFRGLEAQVLADALASTTPAVIAAAGGTVLDEGNRRLLCMHTPVVWLRADVATLVRRLGAGEGRPLLAVDAPRALARLDAQRRPLYLDVADLAVDVDDLSPDEVVERIEVELAGLTA